jgi:hypothetical protein
VHTVVIGGMPGWQIALIAAAAALIAAMVAMLMDRARTARRQSATTAAWAARPHPTARSVNDAVSSGR